MYKECDIIDTIKSGFDGFNQFSQLIFGFALGLAFSQANITVGWIMFWIIVWELGVFLLFGNTIYYDPFFRVAYNCLFLISILIGQYLYFGKTTFQNFLYPGSQTYDGTKYSLMTTVEENFDKILEYEEKKIKKTKLNKKRNFFLK